MDSATFLEKRGDEMHLNGIMHRREDYKYNKLQRAEFPRHFRFKGNLWTWSALITPILSTTQCTEVMIVANMQYNNP
jgi:hypothetical protein